MFNTNQSNFDSQEKKNTKKKKIKHKKLKKYDGILWKRFAIGKKFNKITRPVQIFCYEDLKKNNTHSG